MKSKVVLSFLLVGLIVVSTFMVIAIAQTEESQNKLYCYSDTQIPKNGATIQSNESETFTFISATELPGEKSWEPTSSKEENVMALEIAKKKVNIEPILEEIIENSVVSSSEIVRVEASRKTYKIPPDISETVLAKIYLSNKSSKNLNRIINTTGLKPIKYYQDEGFIKARIPIANITDIASLSEITDVRRVINFPLTSVGYNIRVENNVRYYHVFMDIENHAPTGDMVKTLENLGVKIKKRYNDGITDFRVYLPVDNLTKIAELPFVTNIEYHDVPAECELYMSKKMIGVDYFRDNINSNLKGSGVRLAVIDSGIDHHQPYLPTPIYELDVKDNWLDDDYAEDDIGHGTHVIGIIANNYNSPSGYEGVAPESEIAVIKYNSEPGPFGSVNQQIYDAIDHAVNDADAQVISMSLGIVENNNWVINSDGTTKWEQKADWAAREGAIFVKSAGNQGDSIGYNSITCPGTAKNVIAVGATNHWYHEEADITVKNTIRGEEIDEIAVYSSRGDTGDNGYEGGRDKPEVVAPGGAWCWDPPGFSMGDGVVSARGRTDDQSAYLPDVSGTGTYKNDNLYRMTGTSMAAPHVAGTAALVIDNYDFAKSNRNAAIVKAMIVGSGLNIGDNDLAGGHSDNHLDDDIGYGKVDLYQALGYTGSNRKGWYFGDSLESSGDIVTHTFTVPSDKTYHHIKATVTWNDPPTTSTDPNWGALKNDIDINLTGPDGNRRDSSMGWQQNIEQINYYDANGITPGEWKINIKAGVHWDSSQDYGGLICLYTEEPHTVVDATAIKGGANIVQITATVDNKGGETASGVIADLSITEPSGHSIDDYFTIDEGFKKTLLGNIPSAGSRSVSWTLTAKNTIPEGIAFSINATYSNTGLTTNDTATLIDPIEEGLEWLRDHQNPDGSWSSNVGYTSLAALAFLNHGIDESDPAVSNAINYILSKKRPDGSIYASSYYSNYETSLAILPLVATHNPDYDDEIAAARDFLVTIQNDEGEGLTSSSWTYGGWGYQGNSPSWSDLSNAQWSLMGLDAANLPKTDDTWSKGETYVARCQNLQTTNPIYDATNDGGFTYQPPTISCCWGCNWDPKQSYGSMSAAGVWGLKLCGVETSDQRVQAGLNWLRNNYAPIDAVGNPCFGDTYLYYYLLSFAKALVMTDIPAGSWQETASQDITNYIVSQQYADGHWSSAEGDLFATEQAILALQTRTIPTDIQRLSWLTFILHSPADLHVYDPLGRHVGKNYETGGIDLEIPNATYSSNGEQNITLPELETGNYRIVLIGTGTGEYTLNVTGGVGNDIVSEDSYTANITEGEVHDSTVNVAMITWLTIHIEEPEPIDPIVLSATGTGNVSFIADAGTIEDLIALNESDMPEANPNADFSHGIFRFNITGVNPGQIVNITIAFPEDIPITAQYWICGPNGSIDNPQPMRWYPIPLGSNDGDNVITITKQDGGVGDEDGVANGIIVDDGGPGNPFGVGAPRAPTLTPIGIIALVGLLTAIAVSRVRKKR